MERLMALQALDTEAKKLRDEIAALPRHVTGLDQKAKAVAGQRAVVLDLIAKEEAIRCRHESDIEDQRARLTRGKTKRDNATTTVQVNALEHEIAFAEKEILRLEDAELESMMRSEDLNAQKTIADKMLTESEDIYKRERERAMATIDRNNKSIAELDVKRKDQRATIGEASLSIYDRIAKAKGTGISEALNQKCSACQMLVRPQKWNDLRERDNEEVMTCESCGRLLFYDPARDSPQRKIVQPERKESIAAQIVRGG